MVNIKSCCMVSPNVPTPDVTLQLSECDQVQSLPHTTNLFIYRPQQQVLLINNLLSSPFETLKVSLSRALVSYYPLAGRLSSIGGGRFELHCNAAGAEIIEAESDARMEDFGDFRPTSETKKLVPHVDYTKDISELPLLLVQVTRFQCGGICVGVAFSHIVTDGNGGIQFMNSWSRTARGEQGIEPFHDRGVLYNCGDPLRLRPPRFAHIEHKPPPILLGHDDDKEERMKETTTTMLKLSKIQVDKLKKNANQGRAEDDVRREYSRFEAMAGHIWRCASKARKLKNEQITSLRIAVDCRKRLSHALPSGYYSNAVMSTSSVAQVGELLSTPLGLGCACINISESVEKFNDGYIRSAIDFLASQRDITPFRTIDSTRGVFLGNPNLAVTGWFGLPFYDVDFGWGKPVFMGPRDIGFDGKVFIIPAGREEDGCFIVAMRLQKAHMDDFEKSFYQDI